MFGPDICGSSTKRVHAIFTDKTGKNLLTKKTIPCETDELTHVYTLIVHPNNTYAVLVDNEVRESGDLEDHWDFLPPREIRDPDASKPEDWDDRARIPDETDVKPEGWDDIPETITDPEAKKPEDWDDEDDGEWEAPTVPNPEFKGAWRQKTIENPAYKGAWSAPMIPNPEYVADDMLYLQKDLRYVGFELWQVKSGSIFDNVLVTDDVEYAKTFAEKTWGASRDAEKAMFEAAKKKQQEEDDAEAKRLDAEAAESAGDEDEFGDDYDDFETPKDEL
jgi:calreticulin